MAYAVAIMNNKIIFLASLQLIVKLFNVYHLTKDPTLAPVGDKLK